MISRKEYEQYCIWVSEKLGDSVSFSTTVEQVSFHQDHFVLETSQGSFKSRHLSIATGLTPRIPDCAKSHLGMNLFHCKDPALQNISFAGRSVVIIGGGQTGVEIFRNAILGKWGHAQDVQLLTCRNNLEPLDESAFANDYFTPNYVDTFWRLDADKKTALVASQKLASDGNTPSYLFDLYNDLYRLKYVERDPRRLRIMPCRKLTAVKPEQDGFTLAVENKFLDRQEDIHGDIVILCTGFENRVPMAIESLMPRISFDAEGRFNLNRAYGVRWNGPESNRIYALNFSRHQHGIVDPQSSLMAWRSATVINDLMGQEVYRTQQALNNFVDYGDACFPH